MHESKYFEALEIFKLSSLEVILRVVLFPKKNRVKEL